MLPRGACDSHAHLLSAIRQASPAAFASLTAFEPMEDSQCRGVRARNVRYLCAHQNGIRIDLEGYGDQRQYENDEQGSHGRGVARDNGLFSQTSRRKAEGSFRNALPRLRGKASDNGQRGKRIPEGWQVARIAAPSLLPATTNRALMACMRDLTPVRHASKKSPLGKCDRQAFYRAARSVAGAAARWRGDTFCALPNLSAPRGRATNVGPVRAEAVSLRSANSRRAHLNV
jgi:hypothetical protein